MNNYQDILNKYNYSPERHSIGGATPVQKTVEDRLASLRESTNITPERTTTEKIADITGGKELSQGLGQALALRKNSKLIEETQKQQFTLQEQLIERIKAKREAGEDTTRLEGALADLNEEIISTGEGASELLNPNNLTGKQVLGDALQLATTAGGAKLAGSVAGRTGQATSFGQGLVQGAKAGATSGAAVGAVSGAAQGLQQDEDLGGIAGDALSGAAIGGVGGAVIGGALGGIRGSITAKTIKQQDRAIDYIKPKTTQIPEKQYKKLLSSGRIKPKTATSRAEYILSPVEEETAKKYANLIQKDPVKSLINIGDELGRQDAEVGQYLRSNNGIFNKGELRNYLRDSIEEISDIAVDEKTLTRNKDKFVKNFVEGLEKNDMETLWQSRKNFDTKIKKAFGSSTLSNQMKVELRNAVQNFISEKTDDITYKAAMREMSGLQRVKDLLQIKAAKEKANSAIGQWIKDNPLAAKVVGWGAGGLLAKEIFID